ncbi:MAG: DUF1778 domain-containing protein [Candidatus Paracaedibacteraceae bacterium]|nr:DUF1778 domain-containing protein [Candidatus Paracaedibacteraceae bacterium]
MARTQSTRSSLRNVTIQLRAKESQRYIIDRAAHALGKNRSDFLLEAACREAEEILLDQRFFALSEENYNRFIQELDQDPSENPKLKNLMLQKSPWDKD